MPVMQISMYENQGNLRLKATAFITAVKVLNFWWRKDSQRSEVIFPTKATQKKEAEQECRSLVMYSCVLSAKLVYLLFVLRFNF